MKKNRKWKKKTTNRSSESVTANEVKNLFGGNRFEVGDIEISWK
jgi:hypothetical protein